jgi:4-amino-4-deoxy-L-arabinose transferase-like glycosyltransferase
VAALFTVMLLGTWQRWTNPFIDHGRELNLPTRILSGERLYIDVSYHYGPFAPYFNALLYRVFGVHIATLHTAGAVCAVLILLMVYRLSRRVMEPFEATLATCLTLVACALSGYYGNYVQPYSYAALYGWTFVLASVVCLIHFLETRHALPIFFAGVNIGAALICKPEFSVLGLAPALVAWPLASLERRRWLCREFWLLSIPIVAIGGTTYGLLALSVPFENLFGETYRMFNQPGMIYFAQFLNGTLDWPQAGWALIVGTGMVMFACGFVAMLGLALSPSLESVWQPRARAIWGLLFVGGSLWALKNRTGTLDVTPFRSAPVVLLAILVAILWQAKTKRSRHESVPIGDQTILMIAALSVPSIFREILNVSVMTFYTPFTLPGLIILYFWLFFRSSPNLLLTSASSRKYARRTALAIAVIIIAALAVDHVRVSRSRAHAVSGARGRLLTYEALSRPVNASIRLVLARTTPTDYLASLPQGTMINFLTERRNPLREENIVPGVLTPEREADAINRLAARQVPLILIANTLTPEYGARVFGVDYNQQLMAWIDEHYNPIATYSATDTHDLRFGDAEFFIRAYERKAMAQQGERYKARRTNVISANIAHLPIQGSINCSSRRQNGNVMAGTRLRRDTPPESKYLNGVPGLIRLISHSGNSCSNRARSRTKRIHGSAPFAPDNGPTGWNCQSDAFGSNGS